MLKEAEETKGNQLHPARYGGDTPYETKKVYRRWSSSEEYRGWLKGTIFRYLTRFGKKDDEKIEAEKILNYSIFLAEEMGVSSEKYSDETLKNARLVDALSVVKYYRTSAVEWLLGNMIAMFSETELDCLKLVIFAKLLYEEV